MFKSLLISRNLNSAISQNFCKYNYADFSKKFVEKREKIRNFLSTQKQKYKIQLLERKYEKPKQGMEDINFHKKNSHNIFSVEVDKSKKHKKIKNIINNKSAKIK